MISRLAKPEITPDTPLRLPCGRCKTAFGSLRAFLNHTIGSIHHHICQLCEYFVDFETFNELQDHIENYHSYCEPCGWFAPSTKALEKHNTSEHHLCLVCGDYLPNRSELMGHANLHRPKYASCFLCSNTYGTLSAVFNHLESGSCEGGARPEDIMEMVRMFSVERTGGMMCISRLFECWPCQRSFRKLSDLLQHVETAFCRGGYWRENHAVGNLVQFVRDNLTAMVTAREQNNQSVTGGNSLVTSPGVGS